MQKPSREVVEMFLFVEGPYGAKRVLDELENWKTNPIKRRDDQMHNQFQVVLDRDNGTATIYDRSDFETMRTTLPIPEFESQVRAFLV